MATSHDAKPYTVGTPSQPTPNRHSPGTVNTGTTTDRDHDRGTTDGETVAPIPRLLDLRAAARYLGVSYWTVRDLVLAGTLPTVKLPCPRAGDGRAIRRTLIDRLDLDALIEQHRETAQ